MLPQMEPVTAPLASSDLQALEGQIGLLTELSNRVETLRQTPSYLRLPAVGPSASPIANNVASSAQAALMRQGFDGIKEFTEKVQSDPVQEVLKKARESESTDKSDLNFSLRRKDLKRK